MPIVHQTFSDPVAANTEQPDNERYKRNIYYKGALHWNELPVKDRNIETYVTFKESQKKWMLGTNNIV